MRFIKILLLILFSINIQNTTNAANMPASFADLARSAKDAGIFAALVVF